VKARRGSSRSRPAAERRTTPGITEARIRIDTTLQRLGRIDLQVVVVAPPDTTRLAARARARDAAVFAGRGPLLDEACKASRSLVMAAFGRGGFNGTWAATEMSVSVAGAGDRVAAAAAFEETVMAAVTEDLVDDGTLRVLRASVDELVRATGLPMPGSLASIAMPRHGLTDTSVGAAAVVVALLVAALTLLIAGAVGAIVVFAISVALIAGAIRSLRRSRD
jgi:hypothetical protein